MPFRDLKAAILARYPSVHAFCKHHPELSRASVYLLLSGKYPGKGDRQARRIRSALEGSPEEHTEILKRSPEQLDEMLQQIRCANCRRLNRRECMACRDQTAREATELYKRLYNNT